MMTMMRFPVQRGLMTLVVAILAPLALAPLALALLALVLLALVLVPLLLLKAHPCPEPTTHHPNPHQLQGSQGLWQPPPGHVRRPYYSPITCFPPSAKNPASQLIRGGLTKTRQPTLLLLFSRSEMRGDVTLAEGAEEEGNSRFQIWFCRLLTPDQLIRPMFRLWHTNPEKQIWRGGGMVNLRNISQQCTLPMEGNLADKSWQDSFRARKGPLPRNIRPRKTSHPRLKKSW